MDRPARLPIRLVSTTPADPYPRRYLGWYSGMPLVYVGGPIEEIVVPDDYLPGQPVPCDTLAPDPEFVYHLREIFVSSAFPGTILIRLMEIVRLPVLTSIGRWEMPYDARGWRPLESLYAEEEHAEHAPREHEQPSAPVPPVAAPEHEKEDA